MVCIMTIDLIWSIVSGVVTIASAISAITPTKKDDFIVSKVKKVADVLAINVLNAKK